MNIVVLILLTVIPLVFLAWTMRFKSWLTFLSVAPAVLLIIVVLALNADPAIRFIEPVPSNFVTTIVGNTTSIQTHYEVQQRTDAVRLASTGTTIVGEKVSATSALLNDKVDNIILNLARQGNPPGNFDVGVFDANGIPKIIFASPLASSLTTVHQFYVFPITGVGTFYTLQQDDYIGARYTSGGSSAVLVGNVSNSFDGTNTVQATFNGAWTNHNSSDITMTLQQLAVLGTGITSVETVVHVPAGNEVIYPIAPEYMTLINVFFLTGVFSIMAVVLVRALNIWNAAKDDNES